MRRVERGSRFQRFDFELLKPWGVARRLKLSGAFGAKRDPINGQLLYRSAKLRFHQPR